MRPTDENQHGSTRPNLLSGARRRFSEDDNLLARLERDSARQASGNRSRAAWYAVAAALVLLLIVVVGYVAYQNANTVRLTPVAQTSVGTDAAKTGARDGERATPQDPVSAPPAQAKAVPQVEAPATAPDNNVALPPLVLLQAHEVASIKPVTPAKLAEPPPPLSAPPTPVSTSAPLTPRTPTVHALAAAAPQVTPARTAPQVTPERTAPHAAPRPTALARTRKPAPATASAEAPIDTDVALLSAIIIHASSHAEERAQLESAAACARVGDKRCTGRPPAHP